MRRIMTITLACAFALSVSDSLAQTYKWTDKNGTVHFTDDPENLPEPMRSRVLKDLEEQERRKKKEEQIGKKTPLRRSDLPSERLPMDRTRQKSEPTVSPAEREAEHLEKAGQALSDRAESGGPTPESDRRSEWQAKAAAARQRVAAMEAKCKEIRETRDSSNRNKLIFARPVDRETAKKSSAELSTCEGELRRARTYLETTLPEEARRKGIPPGWLR